LDNVQTETVTLRTFGYTAGVHGRTHLRATACELTRRRESGATAEQIADEMKRVVMGRDGTNT